MRRALVSSVAATLAASSTLQQQMSAAAAAPSLSRADAAVLDDRLRGALYGLLIGDVLSAPVHWYYNPADIAREYGVLRDFVKPPAKHPSSILSLSSTGGGGRGSQQGRIIGDVINHGKRPLWLVPNTHYHGTLARGEPTLNAQVARVLVRTMVAERSHSPAAFLNAYIAFMRTPGSHNDTYAETYHRMFFANLVAGKPPAQCADDDGHNVASMGGFVLLPPAALFGALRALGAQAAPALPLVPAPPAILDSSVAAAVAQMYATHNSRQLERSAAIYARLLARVLLGEELRVAVAAAGRELGVDVPALAAKYGAGAATQVIGRVYSSACYIDGSFPSLLYLAYVHADAPEAALVANTNAGGENCHRGAALGALLGAAHGMRAWPARWTDGLTPADAIAKEVADFAALGVAAACGELPADAAADAARGEVALRALDGAAAAPRKAAAACTTA